MDLIEASRAATAGLDAVSNGLRAAASGLRQVSAARAIQVFGVAELGAGVIQHTMDESAAMRAWIESGRRYAFLWETPESEAMRVSINRAREQTGALARSLEVTGDLAAALRNVARGTVLQGTAWPGIFNVTYGRI